METRVGVDREAVKKLLAEVRAPDGGGISAIAEVMITGGSARVVRERGRAEDGLRGQHL